MENFLKQDMLKTFLLLLRSVSVFLFVSLLIPITDKKKCAKFNKYIMHATCNRLFSSTSLVQKGCELAGIVL